MGFLRAPTYWFPKIMGFTLDERLGEYGRFGSAGRIFRRFHSALSSGVHGSDAAARPLRGFHGLAAAVHHFALGLCPLSHRCGIFTQVVQLIASMKIKSSIWTRREILGMAGDLEWSTASPPPFYNFAVIPAVTSHEPFWDMKKKGLEAAQKV